MSIWKKAVEKPGKDEAKAIQKEADLILASLEHARHGTKREPLYVAPAQAPKGEYTRVIVPDSHGNKISRHAAAAFLADLKRINPKRDRHVGRPSRLRWVSGPAPCYGLRC